MDLLRGLPDDVTIYDIAQKLEFVAAVRQGLAGLDAGRSVSIEQIPGPSRVILDIDYAGVDSAALARAYPWDPKYRI